MTNYFVTTGSKCEDEITAAKGTLAFQLLSIIIAFCTWTIHRFCLKRFSLILMQRRNLVVAAKTEKVVSSVLAQYSIDAVLKSFEENDIAYFGVATDDSNHNEPKLFPVINVLTG